MSGKLIICRGIPASGKSYWATHQPDCIVVTRDDIRVQYDCAGAGWSFDKEVAFVIPEMNRLIRENLKAGKTVISADTNLNPKVVYNLMQLADWCDATVEVKWFDTELELCVSRDSRREPPWKVGEIKIREYFELYKKVRNRELGD